MSDRKPIRRALLSVWDKTGVADLARAAHAAGVELVSTGSTADAVARLGLPVTTVEQVTGAPEMLGGRVKTLHPRVHAGLLADVRDPAHARQLQAHGIAPFDLVVCNLYPFERTVADPAAGQAQALERIDVGGPAMLRAAAKNFASVAVVCDPADYPQLLAALEAGGTTLAERRALAARAFARTAAYDAAIAAWFARDGEDVEGGGLPARLDLRAERAQPLRYGENPHQRAAFYRTPAPGAPGPWGLGAARQLAGRELSYNNLLDADAALGVVREYAGRPFAVIVKHTNPCGAALGATLAQAYERALAGDPVSAYGGVVGVSGELDAATAERIAGIFTEVVLAPAVSDQARRALAGRPSLRLVQVSPEVPEGWIAVRSVAGGLLAQEADLAAPDPGGWKHVAGPAPDELAPEDLDLAWRLVRHVKSNAIVLVRDRSLVGVGAGQASRVESARIAVARAGERARGAVAASDAFFPFPDGVEELAAAGVQAIVQPGGSVRDDAVAAAAEAAGVTMLHTGRRHFRH
ncbi:MAG TPA: bifunctional phosphoribosylaminoimidazolecarboxamide formyltransferase/IMP cyclohydrolase [Actinomycetes bacterium]|nr:bifunctional phosphoribosylaminoimidazolecarboxamide formyltransferase/IMP cyclohydrolase [Actinomycetes bacterium]